MVRMQVCIVTGSEECVAVCWHACGTARERVPQSALLGMRMWTRFPVNSRVRQSAPLHAKQLTSLRLEWEVGGVARQPAGSWAGGHARLDTRSWIGCRASRVDWLRARKLVGGRMRRYASRYAGKLTRVPVSVRVGVSSGLQE